MRKLIYLKGALCGVAAVSIWAGWSVLTRVAVTTHLNAWDITALRFGVAALVLFPVLVRRGLALDRLPWPSLAVLICGAGPPYVLLAAVGLQFAPARDQGALNPGFMPLFVAVVAMTVFGERLSTARKIGLSLILTGASVLVGWQVARGSIYRIGGDGLFLCAAFLWACFTVAMRQSKVDPLHAIALVSVVSAALYLPIYLALYGVHLAHVPASELMIQAVFQGVFVTTISLILYGRAIAALGASGGAAFGALVPVLSALFAIPLLGEWPSGTDCAGITLVSVGAYLASGDPLPSRMLGVRTGRPERCLEDNRRSAL